jgi:hypothetical protein
MILFERTNENVFRLVENTNIQIEDASKFDVESIISIVFECFPQYKSEAIKNYILSVTNFYKSFVLTDGAKLYGFYLIGDRQLNQIIDDENLIAHEDTAPYEDKIGVEGVALGVIPTYRKMGYGKQFKNKIHGYDYICGLQFKQLGNLQNWLKTRRLIASNDHLYLTLQDL